MHGETRRPGNLAWLLQRGAERLNAGERERLLEALSADSRLANALVEGKHNRAKVLKRRAYGYRNDGSFLLRILSLIHTD